MQYIQVSDDTFIQYDDVANTTSIISKASIQAQTDALTVNMPAVPSDKDLLTWAKLNYPGLDNLSNQAKELSDLKDVMTKLDTPTADVSAQIVVAEPLVKIIK